MKLEWLVNTYQFTVLCFLMIGCSASPVRVTSESQPSKLNYTVHVFAEDAVPELEITLRFQGSSIGQTVLVMPTALYIRDKSYPGLKDFKVICGGCTVNNTDSSAKKIISSAPGDQIQVEYRLVQIKDSIEPTIQANYFYFNGYQLAHPEKGDQTVYISIDWSLPTGWAVANSFGSGLLHQEVDGVFSENPINNLLESAFVAGDFRIHKIDIHDHTAFFATRGHWRLGEEHLKNVVKKIITSGRDMWRDFDVPYYFVLLLPNGKPCCARGGHGFTHSFVAYLSENENNMERFTNVLAHEHFHYWNGEKLAPKPGTSEYWFTEGFTDYYARTLSLRAGVSSYSDFVDGFNSAIYRYYENPARLANDDQLEKGFNKDASITQLPYSKGDIIGAEWNLAIREKTKGRISLDDLMRAVYEKAKRNADGLTKELVRSVLIEMVGVEVTDQLMRMALSGALIEPSSDALGSCAYVKAQETGKLEYGYDKNSSSHFVSQVKPGSAAERAGLRDGQEIIDKREEWYWCCPEKVETILRSC